MNPNTAPRELDWTNTVFLLSAHALALVGAIEMARGHVAPATVGLAVGWFLCCSLAITGGYHRLFSHPTYKAAAPLRMFYLLFGAGSAQNSALKWSADHRKHHTFTDQEEDTYNIRKGFWWAHMGWVFFKDRGEARTGVKDLERDPLVRFQDRFYLPLAVLFGAAIPTALGALWGDALGAFLVVGFLRLVVQWHATFAINSFTHLFGSRPYCSTTSARDNFWTAIITFGEGYHNFHHRFQLDYRNGVRWYQFDPTKWFVWTLSKLGVTHDLRRTPPERIQAARADVRS